MEAIMSVVYDEYGSNSDSDIDNNSIQMMMLEEDDEEEYTNSSATGMNILTPQQLQIGFLVPRIAGAITLLSSFCMIIMASKRCGHLFHRLILGK